MIAVVAPEPASWLDSLVERLSKVDSVQVFAPWRSGVPGWPLANTIARVWQRGHADRIQQVRFSQRALVDRLATAWLPKDARLVLAPSFAAQRTFALAHARGTKTALIEDMPALRGLHDDLDRAARQHPTAQFLRRYRAPASVIARQEVEWSLSDAVLVRGEFARSRHLDRGVPGGCVMPLRPDAGVPLRPITELPAEQPKRVLLAGIAAARNGVFEALAACETTATILLARLGDGAEPGVLQSGVLRAASLAERERLVGVDAVLAPAWCESHHAEVALAGRLGVPIIGTARAAGFVRLHREVRPGSVPELAEAIRSETAVRRIGPMAA